MKLQWKPPDPAKIRKFLDRYKYVLIVILAGALLLLLPSAGRETGREGPAAAAAGSGDQFDLEALEKKLSDTLSQVEGAGRVTVILTVKSGMEQVLASDRSTSVSERGSEVEDKTVILDAGDREEAVLISQKYPTFQGALVVCQGGDSAEIRLLLTQAVAALTGLGTDHITVCRGE